MSGDVVSFVNVSSASRDDGGIYRCDARNEVGVVSFQERLFISGPPWVKPMHNVSTLVSGDLWIHCPATGYPIERIFWRKGEEKNS